MRNNDYSRCDIRFQRDINTLLLKVTTELTQLNNELKSLRGGTLYTKKYKSNNIFTEYYKGKERSIGKNKDRIHMLARRKYVNSLIKSMTSYNKLLKRLAKDIKESNSIDNINKLLTDYTSLNLDMSKILFSHNERRWLNQPYERNPAYPEELKFSTTNEVLMRTKSELIIANRLEHYNIPYLPEMPLWFSYNLHPKYPDFTILKHDGSTIIWEHMGRMDKEDIMEPGMIDHIIETRILL